MAASIKTVKILLIDDEAENWKDIIADNVLPFQCDFDVMDNSGNNLVRITRDTLSNYKMVICNLIHRQAPMLIGKHFIRRIREINKNIPIFVLTGWDPPKEELEKVYKELISLGIQCIIKRSLSQDWDTFREKFYEIVDVNNISDESENQFITTNTKNSLEVVSTNNPIEKPKIYILHLSDLHFNKNTLWRPKLQSLVDDLSKSGGLGITRIDHLVISGDFSDRCNDEGFTLSSEFILALINEVGIPAESCILVPGNHDVKDREDTYRWTNNADRIKKDSYIQQGNIYLIRDEEKYKLRIKSFSENLFFKILNRPYPFEYEEQGIVYTFPETGIQFLTFNSSWQIDQFYRKRSNIHPEAVAHVLNEANRQLKNAIGQSRSSKELKVLRIGVWHHPVTGGQETMENVDFIGNLQKNNVKIGMHGDVHELRRELIKYWHPDRMHIIGAGSFGSTYEGLPEATPRLYNLLEIATDFSSVRVNTRCQPRPDGLWDGWNNWQRLDRQPGGLPYYDIDLKKSF